MTDKQLRRVIICHVGEDNSQTRIRTRELLVYHDDCVSVTDTIGRRHTFPLCNVLHIEEESNG